MKTKYDNVIHLYASTRCSISLWSKGSSISVWGGGGGRGSTHFFGLVPGNKYKLMDALGTDSEKTLEDNEMTGVNLNMFFVLVFPLLSLYNHTSYTINLDDIR